MVLGHLGGLAEISWGNYTVYHIRFLTVLSEESERFQVLTLTYPSHNGLQVTQCIILFTLTKQLSRSTRTLQQTSLWRWVRFNTKPIHVDSTQSLTKRTIIWSGVLVKYVVRNESVSWNFAHCFHRAGNERPIKPWVTNSTTLLTVARKDPFNESN